MVWIGTAAAVPPVAKPTSPSEADGYHYVEEVRADAPVRARLAAAHVTYVGSHEGCGCGYNSDDLASQGIDDVVDAMALLDAMTTDEREAFLAEQRSRARLRALVCAALANGPVEIYACWAGDEAAPPSGEQAIDPAYLTDRTAPLEERFRYVVSATPDAAPGP